MGIISALVGLTVKAGTTAVKAISATKKIVDESASLKKSVDALKSTVKSNQKSQADKNVTKKGAALTNKGTLCNNGKDNLDKESLQKQTANNTKTIMCAKCGNICQDNAKFCPECGTLIPKKHFCINCGKELILEAKFCPECGTKVLV